SETVAKSFLPVTRVARATSGSSVAVNSMSALLPFGAGELGVRVSDARKVGRARLRVQLLEHGVAARALSELGGAAVLVAQIAEDDRVARAGLRASAGEIAVLHRLACDLLRDACRGNPLRAVAALLHHAAHAHGDVRIVLHVVRLGLVFVE